MSFRVVILEAGNNGHSMGFPYRSEAEIYYARMVRDPPAEAVRIELKHIDIGLVKWAYVNGDPWRTAAEVKGWLRFGDGTIGHIGVPARTYDDWQNCCIGESIKVPMDHPAEESPR